MSKERNENIDRLLKQLLEKAISDCDKQLKQPVEISFKRTPNEEDEKIGFEIRVLGTEAGVLAGLQSLIVEIMQKLEPNDIKNQLDLISRVYKYSKEELVEDYENGKARSQANTSNEETDVEE